jgi:hypothetical protein
MIRGTVVTIGGKRYLMPPLNFNALEKHKEFFKQGKALAQGGRPGDFDPRQFREMLEMAHAALVRNYPALTLEELGDVMDPADIIELMPDLMKISGFVESIPEGEPGKP